MSWIFFNHGCGLVNEDGTRTLCKQQKCKFATSEPFWKLSKLVGSEVETRIMEMRKKTATKRGINKYFKSTFNQ